MHLGNVQINVVQSLTSYRTMRTTNNLAIVNFSHMAREIRLVKKSDFTAFKRAREIQRLQISFLCLLYFAPSFLSFFYFAPRLLFGNVFDSPQTTFLFRLLHAYDFSFSTYARRRCCWCRTKKIVQNKSFVSPIKQESKCCKYEKAPNLEIFI